MRKCLSLLTAEDMKPSYSLAKLALANEASEVNMFRCKTISDNGWCLGSECNLYPLGGFVVGVASATLTGSSEPVPPTNQVNPANTDNVSALQRGVAKLGLEDPDLSDETRAYWFKALFGFKVREVIEHDVE